MRVQVCIPHYFREHTDPAQNPNGYGSLRSGARLARSIALSRCISGLLNLQTNQKTLILNHHNKRIDSEEKLTNNCEIEINVCTDGINFLGDVLELYKTKINHIPIKLENSRELPLHTRDLLIGSSNKFDIYTYMEDDIIIHDPLFFEKQSWFLQKTNGLFILMPHRYERIDQGKCEVLLVDGKLMPDLINVFQETTENVANGMFQGKVSASFDMASNPHSGTFTVNQSQKIHLQNQQLPTDGFIGPLETAATLTTMKFFKILKPSYINWKFLCVEHGDPSFLHYINTLPHQGAG